MGVPKFYRWLSERYPCLSEVVREYQIPEFDNLYLDMNGIIHLCSHPNDDDPHFRITEEKIFSDIFHYVECLFRLIKPKKVFFMAVDGVAPRAKMNQQRGRRFRSAREAQESEKRAVDRGEKLPNEARFDSNCITPGTEFMVKLQEQLKYFVNSKVTSDEMWQGPRIFLSGHETPGEGEHKIMDFIRYEKSQPSYDPNTRHCLYGLDADLIMLGLCTHEPHFSLLREEVRFGGKKSQKRIPTAEETTFHLLHLSLLREYLEHEFSSVKSKLPFPYDLERIVDDWVLMGFLVGNDFIPNLPNMHIVHGALPTLYQAYRDVLPSLDGYINEGGYLNMERFEKYIHRLSQVDYEHFNDSYADFKWLESKRDAAAANGAAVPWQSTSRSKVKARTSNPFAALESMDVHFQDTSENGKKETNVPVGMLIDIENGAEADEDFTDKEPEKEMDEDEEELFQLEFTHLKRDYYMNKLNYEQVTQDVLRDQAECFVRAIQWNLHYYYNGVCSWSWYYPHHYAPYISDIKGFAKLKLDFDVGNPFLPFQQLLAVLPSASKSLLPKPYQNLMCNANSPVIDYYPANFQTDLNGKQQDWEAVVLIPFINETRLLEAMALETVNLTSEERIRNSHGPCLLYTYSETSLGKYPSSLPGKYPDIGVNHAKCTEIAIDGFRVSPEQLCKGLCPGVRLDVYFPGFPTLKHIPHTARLKKAEVKVFQMNSRGDNMILTTESRYDLGLRKAAEEFLGQIVYIGWPHLTEAKIESISNTKCRCILNHKNEISQEDMTKDDAIWQMENSAIQETYFKRWGVEIGETKMLIHARTLIGRKYTCAFGGKVTLEKQWSSRIVPYALQTIVKDIQVYDSSFAQYRTLDDLFPVDSVCFMLGTPNYGCMGKAMKVDSKRKGFIQVSFEVWPDPNLDSILRQFASGSDDYMEGYKASQRVGISGYLFSRITTTFYVKIGNRNTSTQRANIGLNLKFNKKNEEVAGYTKKEGDKWLYSSQTVDVVNTYLMRFPEMFDYLSKHVKQDNIFTDEMLANSSTTIQDVQAFLKALPTHSLEHQRCGSEAVEESVIKQIETLIDQFYATACNKQVVMQVRPHLLYKPNNSQGCMAPDSTAQFQLFDRVVNIRDGYSVPLALRGTIIGIQSAEKEADTVYEILLDKEIRDGLTLRCSPNRGYRLPLYSLINLSHALRADHRNRKPTAVVHPQSSKPNGSLTFENSAFPKSPGKGRIINKQNAYSATPDAIHQSSKQSAQGSSQVIYPNTLNHSPNSPFVLQQPHLLANRPQFVTPKLQTSPHQWTPRQSIANQWQVQGHEPPQDSEFQELWKQLQSSGSTALPPHGPEFVKSNSTLLHAAKSLPKNNQSQRNRNAQHNSTNANELPEQQRQGPPPMPAFGIKSIATNPNPGGEFSNMLQALTKQNKMPGAIVAKNDPAFLMQNLQLQNPDERSANAAFQTPTKGPDYGSKLTVEQLFKETRESESRAKELALKKPGSKIQLPSAPSSSAQDKVAKPILTDGESNSVTVLMNLVQKKSGEIPCYEYIPVKHGPTHLVRASVKLPDGTSFFGPPCSGKEEAAESAAHNALIKSQYTAPASHRGQIATCMGPQSVAHMTGAPVRLAGGMPQHIPGMIPSRMPHQTLTHNIPYGAFPPGNQFYPHAQMYPRPYSVPATPYYGHPYSLDPRFQAQMQFFHSQAPPQDCHQDRSGQRSSQRPPNTQKTASKFEPLQVTKQKMTPKKGSSKEQAGVDSSNPATNKAEAAIPGQPGCSDPAVLTRSSKEQMNNKPAGAPNQRGKQKKKASRLAINFQATAK